MERQKHASIFEILFLIGNPGKISMEESLLKGNLICYISGTEDCRKLKFGEVGFQIRQIKKKIKQKIFRPEYSFNIEKIHSMLSISTALTSIIIKDIKQTNWQL